MDFKKSCYVLGINVSSNIGHISEMCAPNQISGHIIIRHKPIESLDLALLNYGKTMQEQKQEVKASALIQQSYGIIALKSSRMQQLLEWPKMLLKIIANLLNYNHFFLHYITH